MGLLLFSPKGGSQGEGEVVRLQAKRDLGGSNIWGNKKEGCTAVPHLGVREGRGWLVTERLRLVLGI